MLAMKTLSLSFTRGDYSLTNRIRTVGLRCVFGGQFTKLNGRHIDVDIDPIQQWTRDTSDIALDL